MSLTNAEQIANLNKVAKNHRILIDAIVACINTLSEWTDLISNEVEGVSRLRDSVKQSQETIKASQENIKNLETEVDFLLSER